MCVTVVSPSADQCRPQYWEIYKLRQVIGISLFFLSVDILGGVFSFLSLFFRADLDIAAFVRIQFLLSPTGKARRNALQCN